MWVPFFLEPVYHSWTLAQGVSMINVPTPNRSSSAASGKDPIQGESKKPERQCNVTDSTWKSPLAQNITNKCTIN